MWIGVECAGDENMSSELRASGTAGERGCDPCPGGFDVVEQARCEGARAHDGQIMGALARAVPKRSMRVAARTRAPMAGGGGPKSRAGRAMLILPCRRGPKDTGRCSIFGCAKRSQICISNLEEI